MTGLSLEVARGEALGFLEDLGYGKERFAFFPHSSRESQG